MREGASSAQKRINSLIEIDFSSTIKLWISDDFNALTKKINESNLDDDSSLPKIKLFEIE